MKNPRRYLVCRRTAPGGTVRDECVYRFDGRTHEVAVNGEPASPDIVTMI